MAVSQSYIPNTSGIYTITNIVNSKMIVGYTTNLSRRKLDHFYKLRNNKHGSIHFQNAFNKYGESNFKFEVLEECDEEFLCSQENYWCNILNTHNSKYGYNIAATNPNRRLYKLNSERLLKVSNAGKRKMSEETKKKIGDKMIGNTRALGLKRSKESVIKGLITKANMFNKQRKPVLQFDLFGNFIKEFPSTTSTKKEGFRVKEIGLVCKGKHKQHHGYIWKYKNNNTNNLK